mgnify:CR=1 FL=1
MASMLSAMQQYGGGPPPTADPQMQPLRSTGMNDFETPTADPQRPRPQERPQQAFPAANQSFDPRMQQMMQERQQQALMQQAPQLAPQQVRPGQIQPSMMGRLGNPQNQLLPGEQLDPSRMGTGSGQPNRMTIARPPGGGFMGPPPPGAGVRDDGRSANDLQRQLNRGGVSAGNTADVQSEINRLENERFAPLTPQPMTSPKLPGPLGGQPLNPRPVYETNTTDADGDGVYDDLSGDEVPFPQFQPFGGRGNSPFGGNIGGTRSQGMVTPSATSVEAATMPNPPQPMMGPNPFQIPQAQPQQQMAGGYGLSNYQDDQFSKGVMSLPQIQGNFYNPPAGGYNAKAIGSPYENMGGLF